MDGTLTVTLFGLGIVLLLCSRRVRTFLMMIALRDFFDKYMKTPRYRVYNLPPEEDADTAGKDPLPDK
jgi:hypothetical protein